MSGDVREILEIERPEKEFITKDALMNSDKKVGMGIQVCTFMKSHSKVRFYIICWIIPVLICLFTQIIIKC